MVVSDLAETRSFPRGPLYGAAGVVLIALLSATASRYVGVERVAETSAPLAARDLRFVDRPDGGIAVYDGGNGSTVDILEPGSNGFIRGTLRGFARERKLEGVGSDAPFRLTAWADGRLTLDDPPTGRRVDIDGFGITNEKAFAVFLQPKGSAL